MGLLNLLQQGGSTLAYGAGPTNPSFGNDIPSVNQETILPDFNEDGSSLTEYDGTTPKINPLATKQSTLHFDFKSGTEGWSTRGYQSPSGFTTVKNYNAYADGVYNFIPSPTALDLNDPETADPNYKPVYTSAPGNKYEDSDFI
jgi:hypothetical protein